MMNQRVIKAIKSAKKNNSLVEDSNGFYGALKGIHTIQFSYYPETGYGIHKHDFFNRILIKD